MEALKIFLSIRPAKAIGNNLFQIKSKQRKIDEKHLYYKFMQEKENNNLISDLHRMLPTDTNVFLYHLKNKLKEFKSKNILFFIHGYHPIQKSLHLNLLENLYKYYTNVEEKKIGAIIFFSWPNRGLMWEEDDEAAKIGEILATKFPHLFEGLSDIASELGGKSHLMCQSFGHHILNSFLRFNYNLKILFDQVFLMAADIPNLSAKLHPPGILVRNKIGKEPEYIHYNLTNLTQIANQIHVFHDPYDVILSASHINFLQVHERLGKTGLLDKYHTKYINYDYNVYADEMFMGKIIKTNNPNLKILLTALTDNKYNKRHQYFYSNAKVVDLICKQL